MKSARLFVAALSLVLVAAACATGYDRDSAYDDLTSDRFGFTGEQANCILDNVEEQGLEDVVVEDDIDNVDPADIEAVTDIFGECALGDLFTEEMDDAIDESFGEEPDSEDG